MRRLIVGLTENSIVTIPLHHPVPGLSLPVANKFRSETRRSPIVRGSRAIAANLPARLCGAGFCHCTLTQQKYRHGFVLGREHQPATGDEIEHFGIACDLEDHCAKAIAGQSIDSGAQGILCIGYAQHKKT